MRTIRELAEENKDEYEVVHNTLTKRIYMDDIIDGCDTEQDLILLYEQLIEVMNKGKFELKKWGSNSPKVLELIADSDKVFRDSVVFEKNEPMKTLGVYWSPREDFICFKINIRFSENATKRSFLSDILKIFDPMGWIAPVTICFKMLFQELWLRKLTWDSVLPCDIIKKWDKIKSELGYLEEVKLSRFIGGRKIIDFQGFSDASEKAYGAVVFVRVVDDDGIHHVSLLTAKTRVAPLKPVTVPRLELCGAQLLATLMKSVISALEVENSKIFCWSDSKIVLSWISSVPKKWNSFVQNRVSNIIELLPQATWNYVRSADNPADLISRGIAPKTLVSNKISWQGPSWLSEFKPLDETSETFETDLELRPKYVMISVVSETFWTDYVKRFSSLSKLLRVLRFLFRCKKKFKHKNNNSVTDWLTVDEINFANTFLINKLQGECFRDEFDSLSKYGHVKKESKLFALTPFLDEKGLLRVGGRLHNLKSEYIKKHPIVLPTKHFIKLMVHQKHIENLHAGQKFLINLIRKDYWALNLSQIVKKVVNECQSCSRYTGKTIRQIMGPLPECRLSSTKAFLKTGVDFGGPILVRPWTGRGKTTKKAYICLFVCLATKALHLELAMNLDVTSFINALHRLIARRGFIQEIWSDNGRNFTGANNYLCELKDFLYSKGLQESIAKEGLKWNFIPPYTPNFGGLWEAGIRSVKNHLHKSFGDQVLTVEEVNTVLCRIEGILNSRPLLPINDVADNEEMLTPMHFLTGESSYVTPMDLNTDNEEKISLKERYRLMQQMVLGFWARWKTEYLSTLQAKTKWKKGKYQVKVGDLVLLKRAKDPPKSWSKGLITNTFEGKDGVVRVVELRVGNKVQKESVHNLVFLSDSDMLLKSANFDEGSNSSKAGDC